jgi:prolyl-tRNA synthetase
VAPYQAHLISLKGAEARGEEAYRRLREAGIEVIWDDRAESAGVKFADADLIGNPVRLVVSSKTMQLTGFAVEWKRRTETDTELLSLEAAIERLQKR